MPGFVSYRLQLAFSILIVLMIVQAAIALVTDVSRQARANPALGLYTGQPLPGQQARENPVRN